MRERFFAESGCSARRRVARARADANSTPGKISGADYTQLADGGAQLRTGWSSWPVSPNPARPCTAAVDLPPWPVNQATQRPAAPWDGPSAFWGSPPPYLRWFLKFHA